MFNFTPQATGCKPQVKSIKHEACNLKQDRSFILISCLCLVISVLFVSAAMASDLPADRIVAIVNDEVITQSDVEELLAVFYMQIAHKYSSQRIEDEMKRAQGGALNRLIEDKLILQEAKKQKIEVNEKAIEERITEMKKGFANNSEFQDVLSEQGLTLSDLRKKLREQYMMASLVDLKTKRDIRVTPVEITAYYQANTEEFATIYSAEVDSIFCDFEEKINQAHSAIKEGKDFNEVKKEYSSGSPLGLVKKGELLKELDEAIFNLSEGGVSEPVKVNNGFYICKLVKKNPASKLALSEVESQINGKLFKQRMDSRFKEWLDELKKSAYILVK